MAGYIGNKELTEVHFGAKVISAIYKGAKLLWEAALRMWKNKQVWKGKEVWKY